MDTDIEGQVMGILAEQAMIEPEQVKLDSTLDDLGIDSLALVESMFAIEELFDIEIPFNANERDGDQFDISTVGTMVRAIEDLVSRKGK